MQFIIDPLIKEIFPKIKIGVLIVKGINNNSQNPEISSMLKLAEENCSKTIQPDQISSIPKIADWREAYRKFGFKPSKYRSSIESLTRRIVKGNTLPSINPIVDLYNLISIKNVLPIGGDDIDKIEGSIHLTIAKGTEEFLKLGSSDKEIAQKGEIIYRDDKEVLCRCWNYRECEKSKITKDTKNICLVVEGLENTSKEEIQRGISQLKDLISKFCGGNFIEFYLDANTLQTSDVH
jgi:DNA/RNA-binding domain of Phe-tRNA-synthetase-like protein